MLKELKLLQKGVGEEKLRILILLEEKLEGFLGYLEEKSLLDYSKDRSRSGRLLEEPNLAENLF